MENNSLKRSSILIPLVTGLFIIAIWIASIKLFHIKSYVLPSPLDIWGSLTTGGVDFIDNISVTLLESFLGLLLGSTLGFIIGICMAESELFRKMALPYLLASNAIPVIAIAPIIMIWFDNSLLAKVMVSAFISFFPIVLNTHRGFVEYEVNYQKLFRIYNSSKLDFLLKFKLGNAVPYILTGLKINATLSVIGAIIGEFMSSNKGIGFAILQASYNFNSSRLWLYVGFACLIGLSFYTIIYLLEHTLFQKFKKI